jgi:hypothetical protein
MDRKALDRLVVAFSSEAGRRQALGGLFALTAGIFGGGSTTAVAKKKRKKCPPCEVVDRCPQRSACGCKDNTCTLIEGTDKPAITAQCETFCGQGNFDGVNFPIAGRANFCASNGTRTLVDCPVLL